MSRNIFDAAGEKCEPEDDGISPLDLADLPADQKKVMLALLRDQGKYPDGVPDALLRQEVGSEVADFDATLAELYQDNWITASSDGGEHRYRIAFRSKRAKQTAYSLWSVLSDRSKPS
jgi:hypothetical protein